MSTKEGEDLASIGLNQGMPLSYEMDTLAYMSCSNDSSSADRSAFFTFRTGAYFLGGARVKPSFIKKMKDQRRESGDLYAIIRENPITANARLVLSARSSTKLQEVVPGSVEPFFLSADDSSFLQRALIEPGAILRHVPQGVDRPARLEGTSWLAAYDEVQLRSKFMDKSTFLAITLGDESSAQYNYARAPSDLKEGAVDTSDEYVFGSGFELEFVNTSPGLSRRLVSVRERDLETRQLKAKTWTCDRSFKIVRPEDRVQNCPLSAGDLNTAQRRAVREVLKAEDWDINWTLNCVVPKRLGRHNACYNYPSSVASNQINIDYSAEPGKACAQDYQTGVVMCPHFVSVCMASNF